MNSFAAHIAPICGCATSMRRTLNAPTITFSTQKSSRVENTLQPKNRTPARGMRFAATSTRALGESRKARRSGRGEVKVHYDVEWRRCRQGLAGPAAGEDLGGVSDSTKRLAVVGISGSPSPTSKSRVLVEYALAQLAARGATNQLVDLAAPPAEPLLGAGRGDRGGNARWDRRGGDPGVPSDVQRAVEGVLRPPAAGQPDREDRRAAGDGPWPRACTFHRPRAPPVVRESRGYRDSGRGVRDQPAVHRRQAESRATRSREPGGSGSPGPRYGRAIRTRPPRHMSSPITWCTAGPSRRSRPPGLSLWGRHRGFRGETLANGTAAS